MRKPERVEHLYLDFDGFFASVEQLCNPALRGRPVGVIPYEGGHTCIIACSREAKAQGVKNIMMVDEARRICRDLVLVPQHPDLYRRAHNALVNEIASVAPIDQVKSIDELSCRLDSKQQRDPAAVGHAIKRAIRYNIGATITCSIGFAANRHLAKIAGATEKPDGLTIWRPELMPGPLLRLPLDDIPGIGQSMFKRLARARIGDVEGLLATEPKQLRAIWGNVTGERMWYALHGYAVEPPRTGRGMFGHARVLPPDQRSLADARIIARLLLTKAARRVRRGGYYCGSLMLWLRGFERGWGDMMTLPQVNDDQAVLSALGTLWDRVVATMLPGTKIMRVGVTLGNLTPADSRQLDFLLADDAERLKWEAIGDATDTLNAKYGRTVVSIGPWEPPNGGNVGGKISFTRIPSGEDFW
ncbi:MAG: type VI secretion protein ImpB [Pseudomonadota bacterium]|nr:type VI secretion protein ImpB [Pseudomonadota bacterium]